jgi:hypothetical protein
MESPQKFKDFFVSSKVADSQIKRALSISTASHNENPISFLLMPLHTFAAAAAIMDQNLLRN